jgi:uncharacterized protein
VSRKRTRLQLPTAKDRALDEIYAKIPSVPDCNGSCAEACGSISMLTGEWDRVKRAMPGGIKPFDAANFNCPMLSPTGKCMVYTARPFICRLWGTTPTLACPNGCEPSPGWLTIEQAHEIHAELVAVAGSGTDGPVGPVEDLWKAFALDARAERAARIEMIRQAREKGLIE